MSITVSFTDNSTPGPSGPITDWAWTFSDGGTSSDQNPIHDFAGPGRYSARLEVTGTDPDGTSAITKAFDIS